MLRKWTVGNFKSFGRKEPVDLADITLFVGANSSGKSSIIQSILLLKQTLQYAPADRPLALNGPLLKLGTFEDIKNAGSKSRGVSISFALDFKQNGGPYLQNPAGISDGIYVSPYGSDLALVCCDLKFDVEGRPRQGEPNLLQPSLVSSTVSVQSNDHDENGEEVEEEERKISVRRIATPLAAPDDVMLPETIAARYAAALKYEVKSIDPLTKEDTTETRPDGQITGAFVRHFWPISVAVRFDQAKQKAREIADVLCDRRPVHRLSPELNSLPLPNELVALLKETLVRVDNQLPLQEAGEREERWTVRDAIEQLRRTRSIRRRVRHTAPGILSGAPASPAESLALAEDLKLQALYPEIQELLLSALPSRDSVEMARAPQISEAGAQVARYFTHYVQYLGPLRDEPRPLYPLEALANPTDVGYRGEHTAAVLELNKERRISYIPSECFKDESVVFTSKRATLQDAVVDWLSYMGVADQINTGDKGKFGHELQVRTPGVNKYHDLTNVGVGVSQVLPIVVMALLSPVGSLLIFEQPELHLHPRVQTRLADFFLSVAQHGKQCILETHSEYLVYRLRRRIAEDATNELVDLSKMYFVERVEGQSRLRPVPISNYGAILDWPAEFFDQSQDEAERILMAASKKRKIEAQKQ